MASIHDEHMPGGRTVPFGVYEPPTARGAAVWIGCPTLVAQQGLWIKLKLSVVLSQPGGLHTISVVIVVVVTVPTPAAR